MLTLIKRVYIYINSKIILTKKYIDFVADYNKFKNISSRNPRFDLRWKNRYPCLLDNTSDTGFDRHYVFHTAWATRVIKSINPVKHVDIASSLYFSSILSAFIPVDFYDYRPANLDLDNLTSDRGNLMSLPFNNESIDSLSCMHVLEHIGLGRYGDDIDSNADIKAMQELMRVVAPSGNLLIVVPVGKPRIMFNAHRIYSFDQVINIFSEMTLKEFSLIPDDETIGGLMRNVDTNLVKSQEYACGCFWFQKPSEINTFLKH